MYRQDTAILNEIKKKKKNKLCPPHPARTTFVISLIRKSVLWSSGIRIVIIDFVFGLQRLRFRRRRLCGPQTVVVVYAFYLMVHAVGMDALRPLRRFQFRQYRVQILETRGPESGARQPADGVDHPLVPVQRDGRVQAPFREPVD